MEKGEEKGKIKGNDFRFKKHFQNRKASHKGSVSMTRTMARSRLPAVPVLAFRLCRSSGRPGRGAGKVEREKDRAGRVRMDEETVLRFLDRDGCQMDLAHPTGRRLVPGSAGATPRRHAGAPGVQKQRARSSGVTKEGRAASGKTIPPSRRGCHASGQEKPPIEKGHAGRPGPGVVPAPHPFGIFWRDARLRSCGSRMRLRRRIAVGVTSTSSSSAI